jgi:hypothetical protein
VRKQEAKMQAGTHTQTDGFTRIAARVYDLIGSDSHASNAASTHSFSKTLPSRSSHAGELRRQTVSPSPRTWNEILTFPADG